MKTGLMKRARCAQRSNNELGGVCMLAGMAEECAHMKKVGVDGGRATRAEPHS